MRTLFATLIALASFFVTCLAGADGVASYTLDVDSDEPSVITFEAVAERLGVELGAKVERPASAKPTRAAITMRYRNQPRILVVRVVHADSRAFERELHAEGEPIAVQREAVLLAGNLARDEAQELLDALAKRPPPPPPEVPSSPPAIAEPEKLVAAPEEERRGAVFAVAWPVATNWNKPEVATSFDVSLFYGRVSRIDVLGISFGAVHATRSLNGVAIATGVTISGGDASGFQAGVGANIVRDHARGMQAAAGLNWAGKGMSGLQLASGANIALERTVGAQLAVVNIGEDVSGAQVGIVNIARRVRGAQVGVVNIAENVDGFAVGIVSIAKDMLHPIVWTSNLAFTNLGIKFQTKYVYTVSAIGFGTNETKVAGTRPAFTVAVGGHFPLVRDLDLDVETAYSDVELEAPADANRALHLRALPGWSFAKHLRVFAGGGMRIPLKFEAGTHAVHPEGLVGIQF